MIQQGLTEGANYFQIFIVIIYFFVSDPFHFVTLQGHIPIISV